jgi:DNA-binding PadR family transcriptional regulator
MNNSDLDSQNRIIPKVREKEKRKVIIRLIGKYKVDKRTVQNLRKIFTFIGGKREFTGAEIVKNMKIPASVLYPLLDYFESKQIIVKVGEKKSAGRGKTEIYGLTSVGKIVCAYMNSDIKLLEEALREVYEKESNPLKRFFLEALFTNYPSQLLFEVLDFSMRKVKFLPKGMDMDSFISEVFEDAFLNIELLAKEEHEKLNELFKKNTELMEKSEHRDFIFLYFKMQMESKWLYLLQGEKLKKYADSLKENPYLLHIPCQNPECNEVILAKSFFEISIPQYCKECEKKVLGHE